MNIEEIRKGLAANGIIIINKKINDEELLSFSQNLGEIIPDDNNSYIQLLRPKNKGEGISGSFSNNFGFDNFPFHTDTAFWVKPARYLVLKSEFKSNCSTYYLLMRDVFSYFSSEEIKLLNHATFIIKTFNIQKFTSFKFKENGITGFRYDPNTMIPFNKEAITCFNKINEVIKNIEPQKIEWSGNNFIILDNWLGIHARDNSLNDKERLVKRIYIK